MTLLGSRNPLLWVRFAARGWVRRPKGDEKGKHFEISVVGHRGAPRFAAENTIASFQKAVELGADAVEADICVTRDSRFVVWHDPDPNSKVALLRQGGVEKLLYNPDVPDVGSPWRRPVAELDLSALLEHYGYTKNEKAPWGAPIGDNLGEGGIPTLEELLTWAAGERRVRHVLLDIKLEDGQEKQALALLAAIRGFVKSREAREGTLVIHFLVPHRRVARALLEEGRRAPLPPSIQLHADFEFPGVLRIARRLSARHVSMGCRRRIWAGYLRELADVVEARGRGEIDSVVAWTVSDEKALRELVALGPNGILTDDPALLRRLLKERDKASPKLSP